MNKNWKIASIVVIAAALIAGAGSLVMAQTQGDRVNPTGVCAGPGAGIFGGDTTAVTSLLGMTLDQINTLRAQGKSLVEIAATKGVTEDSLVNAILKGQKDALQAAVTAGKISQAQADALLKNVEQGIRFMVESKGVGRFGMGPGMGIVSGDSAVVTKLLGLTIDQINSLRAQGKSLVEIAATKGVSEDTLVNAILKANQDGVAAAVKSGKITQAQADLILKDMTQRVHLMVESQGVGPGMSFGGCRGSVGTELVPANGSATGSTGFGGGFGGMMGGRR
jgi:lambda repressor-like predicted transcriptional regulator